MLIIRFKIILVLSLSVSVVLFTICPNGFAASDLFPVYSSIQPNVSFWKKIYAEYASTQGVIHDKHNLSIIYDVIELKDRYRPGSRKINRNRINSVKKKYRIILAKLARGATPFSPEEKRVADLFGPDAKRSDFLAAKRNLRCQVGQKDFFQKGLIRSGAYLEKIKKIFRDSGLPEDLAYLPHVESSFNPKAYSKFGAAGIWQFTRSTGKRYMTVGYAVDERRDPIFSTRAAARLLKENYQKFKNWPMAITAYNHGVTGMLRAWRIKGNYEAIFNGYRSRIFKFASRNFYSEFLAAREVAKDYRHYFGELNLDRPVRSEEVLLNGYASLPEIAKHLDVSITVLGILNPSLRKPVLHGQKYVPKGFILRLPAASDQDWERRIAELAPKIFKNYQKRSRIYVVRRGDTAGAIARIHGVKLQDLIAANNLDRHATIYINQNLRIPVAGEERPMLASMESRETKTAESGQLQPQPSDNETPVMSESSRITGLDPWAKFLSQVSETAPPPTEEKKMELDVQAAKDPWEIQYVSPAPTINPEILQENLVIERIWIQRGRSVGIIRAEVEETLGHYADWLGVATNEIRRLNGFRYGRIIHINQPIKIPLHKVTKDEFEEKRFEYHKELVEDFFATYRVEKILTYYIRPGDNIWTLSREEFEIPLWLIKKYNADIDFNALMPSQKLNIPVVEKIA
jgi:membrane-bound lytic murein transglycosylase D